MKKTAGTVGLILVVVFLILGFASTTPDKYIKSYGDGKMYEYVGGDAYNFIIEASLRGGEIAGAKTSRAIYFSAAGIILVLSISFLCTDEYSIAIHDGVFSVKQEINDVAKSVEKIGTTVIDNQNKQRTAINSIFEKQSVPSAENPATEEQ